MQTRSLIVVAAAALLIVAFTGCGRGYQVTLSSGPPSALVAMGEVGVVFDWSTGRYGRLNEQEWLARQPDKDREAYFEVKAAVEADYLYELARRLPEVRVQASNGLEPYVIVVHIDRFEMGFYRFVVNRESELDATITFALDGEVIDEIWAETSRRATLSDPEIIERMRYCARLLAQHTAHYVRVATNAE